MTRRGTYLVLAMTATAVLLAGCSSPAATNPGTRSGIGTRSISVTLSGATTYSRTAGITGGAARVAYTNTNGVDSLTGTVSYPGSAGGTATASFDLHSSLGTFSGTVAVSDPSVGVSAAVDHFGAGVTVNGDGDASAVATSGGVTMSWSLSTVPAPGLEPDLDALSADESSFCQDAQQRLPGLTEAQLPAASIGNVLHTSRGAFGSSKASLTPLQVQTWSEPDMATTALGHTVALTHRISCKTRSSDHLATIGLPTSPPLECRALSQRSLDLAAARLTPAQATAYATSGRQVSLQADRSEQTGVDWLTSFPDEVVAGGQLQVTAHALRVDWNDPAFSIFPDTIRGVHYCTVWSPAWAYWWMTVGAFQA
jgi:hypothetical protein